VTAEIPHAGPAARLAGAATTAQPRGFLGPQLLLGTGAGVGPPFVLISLVGLTG
jgi:hypothetical protein